MYAVATWHMNWNNPFMIDHFYSSLNNDIVSYLVLCSFTDKEQKTRQTTCSPLPSSPPEGTGSPFCLLLKHSQAVRLGPKSTLDVPISFAPEDMTMSEALCTVSIMKEDGSSWPYLPTEDSRWVDMPLYSYCTGSNLVSFSMAFVL